MQLTVAQLARMVDLSAVRTDVDLAEVRQLAEVAKRFRCVCTFVMPCYLPELKRCWPTPRTWAWGRGRVSVGSQQHGHQGGRNPRAGAWASRKSTW